MKGVCFWPADVAWMVANGLRMASRRTGMEVNRVRKMTDFNGAGLEAESAGSFPWEFQATANPKARGDNDGDSRGPMVIPKE